MASPLKISNELPFSVERYLDLYFRQEFVDFLRPHMDFDTYECVEVGRTDDQWKRVLKVKPKMNMPAPVKKMMGGEDLSYLETSTYKPGAKEVEWSIQTNVMSEKIKISGVTLLEELASDKCRRSVNGKVEVKIMFGGKLEKKIVEKTAAGYVKGTQLMIDYHNQAE